MNYEDHRRQYVAGGLHREGLDPSPLAQFDRWQQQAIDANLKDPTGAVLATVDGDGNVWQRIILLKTLSEGGFVFFTNYNSNKGADLAGNDRASLLFPWNELDRQVSVSGRVEKTTAAESDAYFASRPRDSQLGAWASNQSEPIEERAALEQAWRDADGRYAGGDVPRPPHWGGYRLYPATIEFWQGGEHRLHDRFRYVRDGDSWRITRLQP